VSNELSWFLICERRRQASIPLEVARVRKLLLLLFACINLCAHSCFADDSICVREIPVNVVLPDASLVRNLGKEQFAAKLKIQFLQVTNIKTDNGPRRIVFVLDTAKENSEAIRKIESGVVSSILAKAREQDTFALITVHGLHKEVRFSETRDVLLQISQAIAQRPNGKNELSGVLDGIHQTIGWLQPRQPGDAIIVVAPNIENPIGISFANIRAELNASGIRLFGLQLDRPIAGYVHSNLSHAINGSLNINSDIQANEQSLDALTAATGGFTLLEDTDSSRIVYKLTDERLDLVRRRAVQFFKAITEFYVVSTNAPPDGYAIELSKSYRAKLPHAMVLYPMRTVACSAESQWR
jgi:hypothetical protein